MTKTQKSTFLLLMGLVSVFLLSLSWLMVLMGRGTFSNFYQRKNPVELHYFVTTEPNRFSLSPYESDALGNATVMEQVVGTLVKYGGTGRYEPYLAKSWDVSPDGKIWDFHLREGITSEDGRPITAADYISGLRTVLFQLSKQDPNLPAFDLLTGWKSFISDGHHESLGITSPSMNVVRFLFEQRPDGFIEFLAMPYYGYYSISDFNTDGTWRNPLRLVASGAYRIGTISENEVVLEQRTHWFSNVQASPKKVVIRNTDYASAIKKQPHAIVFRKFVRKEALPEHFQLVSATPTILNAVVLSPYIKNVFHDPGNRRLFFHRLRAAQQQIAMDSQNAHFSDFFYPLSRTTLVPPKADYPTFKNSELTEGQTEVKVQISSTLLESEVDYIKQVINKVFEDSIIKSKFIMEDRTKTGWLQEAQTNRAYDIRVVRVDIGGNLENWGIKMMFCSNLGIRFPDHKGNMCVLANQFEKGSLTEEQYVKRFNNIINDDVTTIPLWHSSLTWLFSKDIGLDSVTATMNLPRFDLLRLE